MKTHGNRILNCLAVMAAAFAASTALCAAQTVTEVVVDSTAFIERAPVVDSTLAGADIFNLIDEAAGATVSIRQSPAVRTALENQIAGNPQRKIYGFRVRIYFNNSQNARSGSQAVAEEFATLHPQMRVYRSYTSPYFKVTVGDFRTKGEAQRFADSIRGEYPSVFLVRETINYPEI
ncbi:MAG: SPOR domain-containing protein [Bacteroidales bacterium]|nr:SPOR domain-containing protein [Candidatus Cacconaster caballi]